MLQEYIKGHYSRYVENVAEDFLRFRANYKSGRAMNLALSAK
jgi:hypothetical protein